MITCAVFGTMSRAVDLDVIESNGLRCLTPTPTTSVPSGPFSVIDEKESPRITAYDVTSCTSAARDSGGPDCKASRWRFSAVTKQDLMQGMLIIPPLAMMYIFGVVNHSGLEIVYEVARDKGFPFHRQHLRIIDSGYYVAMAMLAIPSSMVSDRVGPRYWLPLMTVLAGIASLLLAFVSDFAGVLVVRIVTGAAFAGVLPSIVAALLPFFGDTRFVLPLAFVVAGGPGLATLVAPISERVFTDVPAIGKAHGWQAIPVVEGILTLGAGVIAFAIMPSSLFRSAVTTKNTAAIYDARDGPSTSGRLYSRHCLVCGLLMTAVVAIVEETFGSLTPLKQKTKPTVDPAFSDVHLWDFLPDTIASVSTIVCAFVLYRKPGWLCWTCVIATVLSTVGTVIFAACTSTSHAEGEYAARVLSVSATQCQIPLIFAILTQERVRGRASARQLACMLAMTNVGFGVGGIGGVWLALLPRIARVAIVVACASCSSTVFGILTIIDGRRDAGTISRQSSSI